MKKKNFHILSLSLLIIFSVASYIYINTAVINDINVLHHSTQQVEDMEQETEKEVMLPDVKAIKTIIENGKRLLPAS